MGDQQVEEEKGRDYCTIKTWSGTGAGAEYQGRDVILFLSPNAEMIDRRVLTEQSDHVSFITIRRCRHGGHIYRVAKPSLPQHLSLARLGHVSQQR